MKIAVLPDNVLIVAPDTHLTGEAAYHLRVELKAALPDWRCVVFTDPGVILDLRDDPEAAAMARELYDRVQAAAAVPA